jgi:hypothetical protein
MIEQRKNQRFDLRLPLEIISGEAHSKTVGETRNVSSSGVLFTAAGVEIRGAAAVRRQGAAE